MHGPPVGFWAKLERACDDSVVSWHPLADHCADVAAVAEALLTRTLLGQRLARLARIEQLDDTQVARLCVLAALHDLGKLNIGFQNKSLASPPFTAGHVSELLVLFDADRGYRESQQLVSAIRFDELRRWADDPEQTIRLMIAAISHHGRPAVPGGHMQRAWWTPTRGLDPFRGIAELVEATRRWFPLAWAEGGTTFPPGSDLEHAFSGLVMLADWLGSDTRLFPFRKEDDAQDRMPLARSRARQALLDIGVDVQAARGQWRDREVTFANISPYSPRPAQQAVSALDIEPEHSVVVIEAETGSGKTEAALVHFLRLHKAGLVDGMYFALPTRTAATQIHARVVEAVQRAFSDPSIRPPVVLAVPGYLTVDNVEGQLLPDFKVLWNDDDKERWRHRGWAAEHPKRYLAGAVVVGTIDQILLSTLQVSHSHMRATALLRQLLVVDEVHASDSYMSTLLEQVLMRHILSGGHALLMSATLGATTRERLLHPGRKQNEMSLEQAIQSPYPCVVVGDGTIVDLTASDGKTKEIAVELYTAMDDNTAVARLALAAAVRGARVMVLRSTVTGCRATQAALEQAAHEQHRVELLFTCENVLASHHARFAAADRRVLDAAIETAFGKDRGSVGCVAVATQTVQQSLDLDADLLVTDLCPMDVLLQRVGRLHRHERKRPPGCESARVVVLVPAERDLSGLIGYRGEARGPHGLGTVYDDLRIIEATWRVLSQYPRIVVPRDNRLLVERALHPEVLSTIASELGAPWDNHATHCAGAELAERRTARLGLARWDTHFGDQACLFPSSLDDKRIGTRLGEGDRLAHFATPFTSPFGNSVRELPVPAWWARGVAADAVPTTVEAGPDAVIFSFGDRTFVYDRLGLRPLLESQRPSANSEEDEADA